MYTTPKWSQICVCSAQYLSGPCLGWRQLPSEDATSESVRSTLDAAKESALIDPYNKYSIWGKRLQHSIHLIIYLCNQLIRQQFYHQRQHEWKCLRWKLMLLISLCSSGILNTLTKYVYIADSYNFKRLWMNLHFKWWNIFIFMKKYWTNGLIEHLPNTISSYLVISVPI